MNSGKIRLYNPHYGNDPNEVIYALKDRFDNPHESDTVLNSLFVLSMNDEEAKEDLNMWKLYGGDGDGVGLVFEFENPIDEWFSWYFGKVFYGSQGNVDKLDEFHKGLIDLQEEFGKGPKLDIDISPIYGFQKSGLFHTENEVRLMHFSKLYYGTHHTSSNNVEQGLKIRKTLNSNFKDCYFIEYPIYWEESNDKLANNMGYHYGPRIRLKEVVLGYRHKEKEIEKIEKWWYEVIKDNFFNDYAVRKSGMVKFSISSLKVYFK